MSAVAFWARSALVALLLVASAGYALRTYSLGTVELVVFFVVLLGALPLAWRSERAFRERRLPAMLAWGVGTLSLVFADQLWLSWAKLMRGKPFGLVQGATLATGAVALAALVVAGVRASSEAVERRTKEQREPKPMPRPLSAALALSAVAIVAATHVRHKLSPRELVAFGAVVLVAHVLGLKVWRAWFGSPARSVVWALAAVAGLVFDYLWVISNRLPPNTRNTRYVLEDQLIRFGSLLAGVLFLMGVLAALLPFALDALERRSFVSFVGARHVRATKSGFLTVISVLSMAGVAVSSCALCSVVSIMGGFGADLKRKILRNNGHVVVDVTRLGGMGEWEDKLTKVRVSLAPVSGAATPIVIGEAMGSSSTNTAGVLVRGVHLDSITQVIDIKENIEVGEWRWFTEPETLANLPADTVIGRGPGGEPFLKGPTFEPEPDAKLDPSVREALASERRVYPGVVLGKELAKSLHVLVGDEVTLISPLGELGPMGVMPRSKKFRVAAITYSGMYEYDASLAFIELGVAQKFFSLEDKISAIDVRVPDPEKVREVRPLVEQALAGVPVHGGKGAELRVRDWIEMNKNLFSALKLERIMTFIILGIAIAVASFCIICTLLLMVTEKGKEIAILKALGASDGAILRVFMTEGIVIGGIGTTFGVGFALAVCTGLKWFGVRLDPEVYYIDRLPVNVNLGDYALVALASLVICTLSTLYPAKAASKLSPLEGLRWE